MELEALLPNAERLSIESLGIQSSVIHIRMRSTEASATCPACQSVSPHVHSRYLRTLKDLPWRGKAVQIELQVRRFFCHDPDCTRRIFAEPFSGPRATVSGRVPPSS